jgi:MoaA/NifB/PqqE/SkfB family radical SAM enzyme
MSSATFARTRFSGLLDRYGQVARMNTRLKGGKAYLNAARAYFEYSLGRARIEARPLKIIFDATNACQLECPLCPTGQGMIDRSKGHASLDMFRNLMKEIGDYVFFVDFYNWGEPLLNPRLDEFIKIASSYNIISTVSTNLSVRLTDERIDRILASGLNELTISLDGASRETQTRYRRKSDFDLICDNIRRIVAARDRRGQQNPLITWQFIVFGFNEHEIARAEAMADELGVDRIVFQPPFLQVERYPLSEEDRTEIATWTPSDPRFHLHIDKPKIRARCGWHYTAAAFNWDGGVTPCCTSFMKDDDFGTIGKTGAESFRKVFNNATFQAARRLFATRGKETGGGICEKCPTPTAQNYHHYIYRRIAIVTFAALAQGVFRIIFPKGQAPARAAKRPDATPEAGELGHSQA